MKRKTRNAVLLQVIKRQESEIANLLVVKQKLLEQEKIRDLAWSKHTDDSIKEINARIRASNNWRAK